MFRTLVVPLDLEAGGDRALPVARALTELGDVTVELLTVSSPNVPDDIDAFELSRRATANGWPDHSYVVIHGDDPAASIVEYLSGRPEALLVMATTAKTPLSRLVLGSVSETVLRRVDAPVLLVGPRVGPASELRRPTLVACVDATAAADVAVPVVVSWQQTFHSGQPWIAEVRPTAADYSGSDTASESEHVRHYAALLAGEGVTASWRVLHGGDADVWLQDFADTSVTEPVFVAVSARWTRGRRHWTSTTRRLVQRSTYPVLVVPARGPTRHADHVDDDHRVVDGDGDVLPADLANGRSSASTRHVAPAP